MKPIAMLTQIQRWKPGSSEKSAWLISHVCCGYRCGGQVCTLGAHAQAWQLQKHFLDSITVLDYLSCCKAKEEIILW